MTKEKLSKQQVRAHLKKKWKKGGGCAVCGANAWIVLDEEFLIPNTAQDRSFPVAIVVCENCGNTVYFSSDVIVSGMSKG